MITYKEVEKKTMNPEKKKAAKNDFFAFYVGRPISYIVTIPFLYTNVTPNTISLISIIPLLIGFLLFCVANTKIFLILGLVCFFIWNLLDGVDGNIARYKNLFSDIGSVYDALNGYVAMVLSFFAVGVAAENNGGFLSRYINVPNNLILICGALSGIFVIFPRLILHKRLSTLKDTGSVTRIKNKENYGLKEIFALNITSVTGFVQVFILIAILFELLDVFTVAYFFINLVIMIFSIKSVLQTR